MFLHFGILLLLSQGIFGEVDVSEAIDGDSRLIGGQDATPGMAKYQVSIRGHRDNYEWNTCGGSIINRQYVLTAAHCIVRKQPYEMSIVVGSHQIKSGGQRYEIKKLVPHENFSKSTVKNDIGVVQVEGNIQFNNKVQPIFLYKQAVPIGRTCLLTGWGKTDFKNDISPNNLQMLYYQTISNNECNQKLYRNEAYRAGLPLNNGQLCGKRPNGKGSCKGDSGGPVVINEGGNLFQIGVVSWGIPCGEDYPDVFTSVSGNYAWIQRNIN